MSPLRFDTGDILDAATQVVVNPWNTNRWGPLLFPSGVSGALKQVTGPGPWRELRAFGPIAPGAAVVTSGGESRWTHLIHVAGITWRWHSDHTIVHAATIAALDQTQALRITSVTMPLIGSGAGGLDEDDVVQTMRSAIENHSCGAEVVLLRKN